MKMVQGWQSRDGKVFDTADECWWHEQVLEFDEAMREDDSFSYGVLSFGDAFDLLAFLKRRRVEIANLMEKEINDVTA